MVYGEPSFQRMVEMARLTCLGHPDYDAALFSSNQYSSPEIPGMDFVHQF